MRNRNRLTVFGATALVCALGLTIPAQNTAPAETPTSQPNPPTTSQPTSKPTTRPVSIGFGFRVKGPRWPLRPGQRDHEETDPFSIEDWSCVTRIHFWFNRKGGKNRLTSTKFFVLDNCILLHTVPTQPPAPGGPTTITYPPIWFKPFTPPLLAGVDPGLITLTPVDEEDIKDWRTVMFVRYQTEDRWVRDGLDHYWLRDYRGPEFLEGKLQKPPKKEPPPDKKTPPSPTGQMP